MSQSASRHRNVLSQQPVAASGLTNHGQAGLAQAGNFSVNAYADRLMDDLFEDVEQALAVESDSPEATPSLQSTAKKLEAPAIATAEPESASPPPAGVASEPTLPTAIATQGNHLPQPHERDGALALPVQPAPPSRSYDRLLVAISCISVLLALGAWLLNQELRRDSPTPVAMQTQIGAPEQPINPGFAEYVQRSLDAIERRTQSNPPLVAIAPNQPANGKGLPTVAVPARPTAGSIQSAPVNGLPNSASRGLARVYVPNYPIPPNLMPNQSTLAQGPATGFTRQPSSNQRTVQVPPSLAIPGVVRTLRGVVELGDRSAALIEINGIVQSFHLGESLGSSGWTLVEVAKDKIIIRRNGEVRSVTVEQNF